MIPIKNESNRKWTIFLSKFPSLKLVTIPIAEKHRTNPQKILYLEPKDKEYQYPSNG